MCELGSHQILAWVFSPATARLGWQQCCLTGQQIPLDGEQLFVLGLEDLEQSKCVIPYRSGKESLPSGSPVESLCKVNRLRSGVDPVVLRRVYSDFSVESTLLLAVSSDTCLIVGSMRCTLFEDFEAFLFVKKLLEGSRTWSGVSFGEDGNGGSDVRSGELDGSSIE